MSSTLDLVKLKAMATELARDVQTEKNLATLSQLLVKLTVETAIQKRL